MNTRTLRTLWLVAVSILAIQVARPALAADPVTDSFTAGMLTFTVSGDVYLPGESAIEPNPITFANNHSTAANRANFVRVTGPANTGGINVDYHLKFKYVGDMVEVSIGQVVATNATIGLDGTGTWYERSVISGTYTLTRFLQYTALTDAYIKFRPSGVSKDKAHYHTVAVL